jgi:hypothetical protein
MSPRRLLSGKPDIGADMTVGPLLTQSGPKPGRNPAVQRAPDLMLASRYAATDSVARGSECNSVN